MQWKPKPERLHCRQASADISKGEVDDDDDDDDDLTNFGDTSDPHLDLQAIQI